MNSPFGLRGRIIHVEAAYVYPNSSGETEGRYPLIDKDLVIRGIVLANRTKTASAQEPYAYIASPDPSDQGSLGRGIWLDHTMYSVVDNPNNET